MSLDRTNDAQVIDLQEINKIEQKLESMKIAMASKELDTIFKKYDTEITEDNWVTMIFSNHEIREIAHKLIVFDHVKYKKYKITKYDRTEHTDYNSIKDDALSVRLKTASELKDDEDEFSRYG